VKNAMSKVGISVLLSQQRPIPLQVKLDCKPGELLALTGPSGSGKTTILRAIAGLYQARRGHVECNDEIWQDGKRFLAAHRRHVGLVFQQYALFPHLTVFENIRLALPKQSKSKSYREVMTLLAQVHLTGLEKRYPKQLSGGQKQRVAVARALARKPAVLLLDEPFSAVDQVTRRKLYRELLLLRQSLAIPIILVTHDLEESALLADNIALLHKGEVLQTGTPETLLKRPQTVTIARLMDQQNVFEARVIEQAPNQTILNWHGIVLHAQAQPDWPVDGNVVHWMVPASGILLHRRDRPSRGEKENPLSGRIVEYFETNGQVHIYVSVDQAPLCKLNINVPLHVAQRNRLSLGETISFSILAQHIHLMKS